MLPALLARLNEQPSRTGSLIITLYGDAIAPRGGSVWLGTLLTLFRAMAVGDGVVRTAVSRLAAEGWLARQRIGRNSFYQLAERGAHETADATPRIYGSPRRDWTGRLALALIEPGAEREAPREAFFAAGYAQATPALLIAPDPTPAPDAADSVLRLTAEADVATLRRLAARAWPLADLATRYRRFLEAFADLAPTADPLEAMLARVLLIHEWRRVILRDPHLPSALLPEDWPGERARARTAALYDALYPVSEQWLDAHGVTQTGAMPPAADGTRRMFAPPATAPLTASRGASTRTG